jgi:hypothetical protein
LAALQHDVTERQTALQILSQRWLEQAAPRHLWTVTAPRSSAGLSEPTAPIHP